MALPQLDVPIFELTLPLSQKTIKYRPFLVKEEKVMLIAQETGDRNSLINALIQIVNNCVIDDINVEDLPMVELEYLFLQLRAKSVDNVQKINLRDREDDKVYELEVNLDDVKIVGLETKIDKKIDLTDEIGVVMRLPNVKRMVALETLSDDEVQNGIEIFKACIEKIYDKDNVYEMSDHSKQELDEFVESMSSQHFQKIQDFFSSLPKLSYELKYTNSNKKEVTYKLEGLADFFQ